MSCKETSCFCSILRNEWFPSISTFSGCALLNFRIMSALQGIWLTQRVDPNENYTNVCSRTQVTPVWASQIFYCEVQKLIAKPNKILECMGKAPCATHTQHTQSFWAALQSQVSHAKRMNRAQLCPMKLSHLHSTGQITQADQNPLSSSWGTGEHGLGLTR